MVPYLTLMQEAAPQRVYALREVFSGLRWLGRAGASWRMLSPGRPLGRAAVVRGVRPLCPLAARRHLGAHPRGPAHIGGAGLTEDVQLQN